MSNNLDSTRSDYGPPDRSLSSRIALFDRSAGGYMVKTADAGVGIGYVVLDPADLGQWAACLADGTVIGKGASKESAAIELLTVHWQAIAAKQGVPASVVDQVQLLLEHEQVFAMTWPASERDSKRNNLAQRAVALAGVIASAQPDSTARQRELHTRTANAHRVAVAAVEAARLATRAHRAAVRDELEHKPSQTLRRAAAAADEAVANADDAREALNQMIPAAWV